jgi:hypothetical protein
MKNLAIVLAAIFPCYLSAQKIADPPDTLVLKDILVTKPGERIYYSARPGFSWDGLKQQLQSAQRRTDTASRLPRNGVVLTKEELHDALAQLDAMKGLVWKDSLFQGAQRVDTPFRKARVAWIHQFSKPVFFRQATLCLLVRYAMTPNGGGFFSMAFYEQKGARWQQTSLVYGGDF